MPHNYPPLHPIVRLLRLHWISIVALVLAVLVLLVNRGAWAAPLNQTVPPKPTETPTNVPQATNTPQDDDDDDDNGGQQPPAATPTAGPTANATTAPSQPSQPVGEGLTGVVTANRLNVREGPGTNAAVIGVVVQGTTLQILERNAEGTWWHICCLADSTTTGWISAQFVQPNFDATQANTLIPVAGAAPAPAPTVAATAAPTTTVAATPTTAPTVAATSATTSTTEVAAVATPAVSLDLTITQDPEFAAQGQEIELQFVITNPGDAVATNVEVRDELPAELTYVRVEIADGDLIDETAGASPAVFTLSWPELGPGDSATATVTVQIADDLPDGAVVDNLAVVSADNVDPYTAGITIGMPPTMPPDFQ
jgi:uncharacterized repeat protein (TIGR01451 family)